MKFGRGSIAIIRKDVNNVLESYGLSNLVDLKPL